jgi:hypothetical protein
MNGIGKRIKMYWQSQNLPAAQGCTDAQIRQFEARYKVLLPDDMRDYFLTVNGMVENMYYDQDRNGFSFWPLRKVKTVVEEAGESGNRRLASQKTESFFVFSDYLCWCWAYAIRLSQNRRESNDVILLCCRNPVKIADSFSQFAEFCMVDDERLYPPDGHGHC